MVSPFNDIKDVRFENSIFKISLVTPDDTSSGESKSICISVTLGPFYVTVTLLKVSYSGVVYKDPGTTSTFNPVSFRLRPCSSEVYFISVFH